MARRIIVPLDGSSASECALPLARGIAGSGNEIAITLLSVLQGTGREDPSSAEPAQAHSGEVRERPSTRPGEDPIEPEQEGKQPPGVSTESAADDAASTEAYLQEIAETFGDIPVETKVLYGEPGPQILDFTSRRMNATGDGDSGDCAIVMASHGRTGLGRVLLGSVAWSVVSAESSFPVFLVRSSENDTDRESQHVAKRLLVALDGSTYAEQILPHVKTWLANTAELVHLVRIVVPKRPSPSDDVEPLAGVSEPIYQRGQFYLGRQALRLAISTRRTARVPDIGDSEFEGARMYLGRIAGRLEIGKAHVTWQVVRAEVSTAIQNVARACEADVIALTTRGRTGFERVRMGSVAEDLLQHAELPLMMIHPQRE